jgi:hypothetical protein
MLWLAGCVDNSPIVSGAAGGRSLTEQQISELNDWLDAHRSDWTQLTVTPPHGETLGLMTRKSGKSLSVEIFDHAAWNNSVILWDRNGGVVIGVSQQDFSELRHIFAFSLEVGELSVDRKEFDARFSTIESGDSPEQVAAKLPEPHDNYVDKLPSGDSFIPVNIWVWRVPYTRVPAIDPECPHIEDSYYVVFSWKTSNVERTVAGGVYPGCKTLGDAHIGDHFVWEGRPK